ncbi:polysaccharide deacetylase family protein [Aquimarina sp. TRL1]|uniref:polysaccharide deacetylase family protein n=1 Tax=Aquimarina sp. (strain TRL1) TaxID=2736252 RepID=UPI00158CC29B|nr:polysaccharide deacetylase family protein [Aquimarina sp. TRL1]QKX05134.1 polysaccharide deacetylase family protein [Aquimarina sp. TRL1]
MIPYKTPKIIKKIFSGCIWDYSNTHKKHIHLTFDDGPIPDVTEFVLDELKKYNARATFFCIGDNINKHPSVFKRILSEGHSIGNHTMNHLQAWKTPTDTYVNNIILCEKQINSHCKRMQQPKLFRPPHGQITLKTYRAIKKMGYKIILWDVLSKDWEASIDREVCSLKTIKHTEEGSIVVFHDSLKAANNMKYALPKVLAHFHKNGYTFNSIT